MSRATFGLLFLVGATLGIAALSSVAATAPGTTEAIEDPRAGSAESPTIWGKASAPAPLVTIPAAPPPVPGRVLSGNPLWAIPLSALSGTRDRPIFSSTRRPPPPAFAPATVANVIVAPKPREPERPPLSLAGTVASGDEGFGIFLDQSTRVALRLRVGDEYQGWKLRSVRGREVILEKDQQAITLALPQHGVSAGEVRPQPAIVGIPFSANVQPRPDRPMR